MEAFRDDDKGETSMTVTSGEPVPLPVAQWLRSGREWLEIRGTSRASRRLGVGRR